MAGLKEIKQRIGSVQSTRQVTSAMKMVSAAKLRKAQQWIFNARPYAGELDSMISTIVNRLPRGKHPLLHQIPDEQVHSMCIIVVTADKGLCGAFNLNIIKKAERLIAANHDKKIELICVGKKGWDYFKQGQIPVRESYLDFFNTLEFGHSREIMELISCSFLNNDYDKVVAVYNEFKTVIQQNVIARQLLPITELPQTTTHATTEYLLEPDSTHLLETLIKKNLDVQLWRILLESSSAEQGARMSAMDAATDSADDMIKQLNRTYHHIRQSKITTEIIEIASAAEAMK